MLISEPLFFVLSHTLLAFIVTRSDQSSFSSVSSTTYSGQHAINNIGTRRVNGWYEVYLENKAIVVVVRYKLTKMFI